LQSSSPFYGGGKTSVTDEYIHTHYVHPHEQTINQVVLMRSSLLELQGAALSNTIVRYFIKTINRDQYCCPSFPKPKCYPTRDMMNVRPSACFHIATDDRTSVQQLHDLCNPQGRSWWSKNYRCSSKIVYCAFIVIVIIRWKSYILVLFSHLVCHISLDPRRWCRFIVLQMSYGGRSWGCSGSGSKGGYYSSS
jgi:hypothetical protein